MRFESLHPHNIAQKTAVMLDHFRTVTARKMGGRAKAMLVTPSRLHAVRYMREFTRQIREGRINGVRALVAFSGEVRDTVDGVAVTYTEEGLNQETHGFRISEKSCRNILPGSSISSSWPRNTRPVSTSPCSTPCSWTSSSAASRPCRPSRASTAPPPARKIPSCWTS